MGQHQPNFRWAEFSSSKTANARSNRSTGRRKSSSRWVREITFASGKRETIFANGSRKGYSRMVTKLSTLLMVKRFYLFFIFSYQSASEFLSSFCWKKSFESFNYFENFYILHQKCTLLQILNALLT